MRVIAAIVCLIALSVPSTAPASEHEAHVTLWPAKTNARVFALGTVSPPHPGDSVRIRLLRDTGAGFVRLSAKNVTLSPAGDDDGDGSLESHYSGGFDRPRDGNCKLVVIYRGASRAESGRGSEIFPCATPDFPTGSATITSANGLVDVGLQIAETGEQHGYGLMYRRWLAENKGMAFLFGQDTTSSFYMQNTLIPLSIAFFDQGGRILKILDMDPCDDPPCPLYDPGVSYRGALEVNQGAFERWVVGEGDIITISR